jgi:DNA polymerase-3 subunit delta'
MKEPVRVTRFLSTDMAFLPDQAFTLIARAFEQDRLAHAFLISGTNGDDLRALAVKIAALVNDWNGVETLDDLRGRGAIVIEPEGKIRQIKVETMREAEQMLRLTSQARVKLCVISDADRLNASSSNCFLKTLEEPPANTLILLLTRAPGALLDTIRSRCVRVPLHRNESGGLALSEQEENLVNLLAAYFTGGKPDNSRAAGLLADVQNLLEEVKEEIAERHKVALKDEVETYSKTTDGIWLKERADYYDDLTESAYQEQRNGLLGLLFTWLGEIQRRHFGLPALDLPAWESLTGQLKEKHSVQELQRRIKAVEEMRRNLATNVREVLALEVGFLNAFGN